MKIGYPGNMFEVPSPVAGMGFANNSDTETFELDSGGRFVVNKPTSYKSFNMSWRSKTQMLQPIIDIYNKRYGTQPFYLQDLEGGVQNILPARWAYPAQLAAIHGACGSPRLLGNWVSFESGNFPLQAPTLLVPLIEGKPMYLAVFNDSATPNSAVPVVYRLYDKTGARTSWSNCPFTVVGNAPKTIITKAQSQTYEFVEIKININGDLHYITHMDMSTSDYRSYENPMRSANGVGGLQFTNVLDGELNMLRTQRIGLSVDLTEVQG